MVLDSFPLGKDDRLSADAPFEEEVDPLAVSPDALATVGSLIAGTAVAMKLIAVPKSVMSHSLLFRESETQGLPALKAALLQECNKEISIEKMGLNFLKHR